MHQYLWKILYKGNEQMKNMSVSLFCDKTQRVIPVMHDYQGQVGLLKVNFSLKG